MKDHKTFRCAKCYPSPALQFLLHLAEHCNMGPRCDIASNHRGSHNASGIAFMVSSFPIGHTSAYYEKGSRLISKLQRMGSDESHLGIDGVSRGNCRRSKRNMPYKYKINLPPPRNLTNSFLLSYHLQTQQLTTLEALHMYKTGSLSYTPFVPPSPCPYHPHSESQQIQRGSGQYFLSHIHDQTVQVDSKHQ